MAMFERPGSLLYHMGKYFLMGSGPSTCCSNINSDRRMSGELSWEAAVPSSAFMGFALAGVVAGSFFIACASVGLTAGSVLMGCDSVGLAVGSALMGCLGGVSDAAAG